MSRGYTDNNKDIDSEAEVARRRSFLEEMEHKFELKRTVVDARFQ